MRKILPLLLVIILSNCSFFKKTDQFLFVQKAKSGNYDGKVLTLKNPAQNTVLFSNRPQRIVRTIDNLEFLRIWKDGRNSFKKDHPNSAISYVESNGKISLAIVENYDFKISKNYLSYKVKILSGTLPKNLKDITILLIQR